MYRLLTAIGIFFLFITAEATVPDTTQNAHTFKFQGIDGGTIHLSDYAGKVVLVVNTASQCGFTPQYSQLQQLYDKYKDKGLVVLGVPSGNFMGQEFESETEVRSFTEKKFAITFPLTKISDVKGDNAHPFYRWAGEKAGFVGLPRWNFHKYLIDKQGNFASWFGTPTSPMGNSIAQAIEKELAK